MIEIVVCPICGKELEIKHEKGYIYHRPWAFHFGIDHKDLVENNKIILEEIPLWLNYPWVGVKAVLNADGVWILEVDEGDPQKKLVDFE